MTKQERNEKREYYSKHEVDEVVAILDSFDEMEAEKAALDVDLESAVGAGIDIASEANKAIQERDDWKSRAEKAEQKCQSEDECSILKSYNELLIEYGNCWDEAFNYKSRADALERAIFADCHYCKHSERSFLNGKHMSDYYNYNCKNCKYSNSHRNNKDVHDHWQFDIERFKEDSDEKQ